MYPENIIEVEYNDGVFEPFGDSSGSLISEDTIIIGNIYENPELLKK